MKVKENQILIIFGASGDLTRRKLMPALYNLFRNGFLPEKFAVIGVGRTRMDDNDFRNSMHDALVRFHTDLNNVPDKDFISMLHYIALNTEDPSDYKMLKQKILSRIMCSIWPRPLLCMKLYQRDFSGRN